MTAFSHFLPPLPDLSDALCTQVDSELFFPVPGDVQKVKSAKAVCGECPARNACLTYALDNPVNGIWGGTTDSERRRSKGRGRGHTLTTSLRIIGADVKGCGTPAARARHLRDGVPFCMSCDTAAAQRLQDRESQSGSGR